LNSPRSIGGIPSRYCRRVSLDSGQTVFRQLLQFLPWHDFNRYVQRYCGDHRARNFSTLDQFLCLGYAQVAGRESLRDIETCLNSHREKLYHIGFQGTIPTYVAFTTGKLHDVRMLDTLPVTEDAIYTMDKAYTDFSRLHALHRQGAFFVLRAKDNLRFKRLYSVPKDKTAGINADQMITLVTFKSKKGHPDKLRRVS